MRRMIGIPEYSCADLRTCAAVQLSDVSLGCIFARCSAPRSETSVTNTEQHGVQPENTIQELFCHPVDG